MDILPIFLILIIRTNIRIYIDILIKMRYNNYKNKRSYIAAKKIDRRELCEKVLCQKRQKMLS